MSFSPRIDGVVILLLLSTRELFNTTYSLSLFWSGHAFAFYFSWLCAEIIDPNHVTAIKIELVPLS